jgi:uncharacterized membrane protein YbhN (UPF0104 family)
MAMATYLSLLALGADDPSLAAVIAITCMLNLVWMVPITPLGLGVTDTAAEFLFALIGISVGAEQQMLIRLFGVLLSLAGGLAFFWRARPGTAR